MNTSIIPPGTLLLTEEEFDLENKYENMDLPPFMNVLRYLQVNGTYIDLPLTLYLHPSYDGHNKEVIF